MKPDCLEEELETEIECNSAKEMQTESFRGK